MTDGRLQENPISMAENPLTNPTIFLRLRQSDAQPRELAWGEFHARYAPIIAGFARRLGARHPDIDDIVQDVMLGFFSKAPTFIYDPAKGRFRGYLKVCTYRAAARRLGKDAALRGRTLEQIDPEELAINQIWDDVWEQQLLRLALEDIRKSMGHTKTFQAFESYVIFDQPAQAVADKLQLHLNSVYRAKEQVTKLLHEKLRVLREDE